jgi:hypothetical protein
MMITGSARLNIYRKGGDSMLGRYYYYRLHPLSLAEVIGQINKYDQFSNNDYSLSFTEYEQAAQVLNDLFELGGFPENFISKNKQDLARWHNERKTRLTKEDIRDVELIREFSLFQVLVDILPTKVGSLFSINSLREDLSVAHQTLQKWIEILDNFYYTFRIFPFSTSHIKSLKKEPKLFLWDWSELNNEGVKFENLIASHLLKFVHFFYDVYGIKAELRFIRDAQKREVDFVITIDKKPIIAIEAKLSDKKVSKHLKYFASRLDIPWQFQVVKTTGIDFEKDGVRVMSADKFLTGLV